MDNFEILEQEIYNKLHKRAPGIDKLDRLWEAAVLLPLVNTKAGPSLLFEVRALQLNRQPGEICFPGGKYECDDKDFSVTAIRETCEELGINREDIKILGKLDCLVTHMGPIIHPFVGVLKDVSKIKYNSDEVEEVFTVPVRELLEQTPRQAIMQLADKPAEDFPFDLVPDKKRGWRFHKEYNVYFYQYQHHVIWGLTARMLYAFLRRNREILQKMFKNS